MMPDASTKFDWIDEHGTLELGATTERAFTTIADPWTSILLGTKRGSEPAQDQLQEKMKASNIGITRHALESSVKPASKTMTHKT